MGARVLILGAGPAGLAIAASLAGRRVEARLVDRHGVAGGAYARMDPAIVMTTPSSLVSLPGLRAPHEAPYLTAAVYARYLEAYAEHHGLAIERARVTELEREGRGYRARISPGLERSGGNEQTEIESGGGNAETEIGHGHGHGDAFEVVVLATGMYDFPVRPTLVGLPADGPADATRPRVVHAAGWHIADARTGERVLVVGGASSAVEIAEACARAGSIVKVSVRDRLAVMPQLVLGVDPTRALMPLLGRLLPSLAPGFCAGRRAVPAADRGFAALRKAGTIEVVPGVARLDGRRAILVDDRSLDVDVVILATGYRHAVVPAPADLERDDRGVPRTRDGESRSHPGLYVIGAPCVRRAASQYLYGMARDAPVIAAAIARRLQRTR